LYIKHSLDLALYTKDFIVSIEMSINEAEREFCWK